MNEYVETHYKHLAEAQPYFPNDYTEEPVFNGRNGILSKLGATEASLKSCGFQLISTPSTADNWNDNEELRKVYLPELRALLPKEFERNAIQYLEFFHPMLRGERLDMSPTTVHLQSTDEKLTQIKTSPTASVVHIDNDIGAFEADRVISLVENNSTNYQNKDEFPRQALLEALQNGQRWL